MTIDGLNNKNLKERENKGIGMVMQTLAILKETSLGHFYFDIGLLLRETNVINAIVYNSEVWVGLTKTNISLLENIDKLYLRKLLNAHSKTAVEAYYMEMGLMPIHFIIKCRRFQEFFSF